MGKVGIYQIGFVEQNEENDVWNQQEEQIVARGSGSSTIQGLKKFKKIDQSTADLSQDLDPDENGKKYNTVLNFALRKELDIQLARKYEYRPVVVYVWTVDGSLYKIGTKTYPARFVTSDRYEGLTVRGINVVVEYSTKERISN